MLQTCGCFPGSLEMCLYLRFCTSAKNVRTANFYSFSHILWFKGTELWLWKHNSSKSAFIRMGFHVIRWCTCKVKRSCVNTVKLWLDKNNSNPCSIVGYKAIMCFRNKKLCQVGLGLCLVWCRGYVTFPTQQSTNHLLVFHKRHHKHIFPLSLGWIYLLQLKSQSLAHSQETV